MTKLKLNLNLSSKSIIENQEKLRKIETLIGDNVKVATERLMYQAYLRLVQLFEENNLEKHVSSIKYELINGGNGFKIYCSDWVVFFNEYGTGTYGDNPMMGDKLPWTYHKMGKFFTTYGQRPKHLFRTLKQELDSVAKEYYSTALSYAINQESYRNFKNSLL